MKAKIPITQSVSKKNKASFAITVKEQTRLLDKLQNVTEVAVKDSK